MWINVDWNYLMQALTPEWWRKPRLLALLRVLISQVEGLHGVLVALRTKLLYDMQFTGQTMSLEHVLNDRFDAIDRGIYIENQADLTQLYIYNKIEAQPPTYLYAKWRLDLSVVAGQYTAHAGAIWKAENDSVGSVPAIDNSDWSYHKPFHPYLINQGEALQYWDFIVFVPVAVAFSNSEMRALVDRYRQAGKRYTIQTY